MSDLIPRAVPAQSSAAGGIRILLLADTHLGFDLPATPRVERRRRGFDFLANFERVLAAALHEHVDCVVHGGDLFYRSRVPPRLVQQAFLPIKKVADAGIPCYVVPGNHERSCIPYDMLAVHPGIHIFDRPRTFVANVNGLRVAFSGFPYCRQGVRSRFPALLESSGWRLADADVRLLCVHHCFEGATVGTHNHTFRNGQDEVRLADVPGQFAAVLTGHVHRFQVLEKDLRGRVLDTPIMYPGAIERTSFAEREELKGYMLLAVNRGESPSGAVVGWEFRTVPARPMVIEDVALSRISRGDPREAIGALLHRMPEDGVVRIRVHGTPNGDTRAAFSAGSVRSLAPSTMNVEVVWIEARSL